MMLYDVTYYRGEQQMADFDREVGAPYLDMVQHRLRPGEVAIARNINWDHHVIEITQHGQTRLN